MAAILVIDDEKDICNLIGIYLKNEGYEFYKAGNGIEGLEALERYKIDLVIADVMMPKMDGITFCMKVREKWNVPIIMVSAKDQDMDKVMGLTAGADDYISKPFNPIELVARVKAQLRRSQKYNNNGSGDLYEYAGLSMDINSRRVYKNSEQVLLTNKEYEILKLLWTNRGMVFSAEHIYSKVWDEQEYDADNIVMVHIRNLRKKIETDAKNPEYITTVWGVGYKFGN